MRVTTLAITIAILTIIASAFGASVGYYLVAETRQVLAPDTAQIGVPGSESIYPDGGVIRRLTPMITNLAEPSDVKIRLEVSVAFKQTALSEMSLLSAQIANDITAYLRTLTLDEIEGAGGIQYLREDLWSRAHMRSEGRVHELLIESMVLQ